MKKLNEFIDKIIDGIIKGRLEEKDDARLKVIVKILLVFVIIAILALIITSCSVSAKKNNTKHYVTLGEYKGLTYTPMDATVTDEEVTAKIVSYAEENAVYTQDETRAGTLVVDGDSINISYKATCGNISFEDEDIEVRIGKGEFANLEAALIGQTVGSTVTVSSVVPTDYTKIVVPDGCQGEIVDFTVTINYANIVIVPEIDANLASQMSGGQCATVDELRTYVKTEMEAAKKSQAETQKKQDLLAKVIANAEFENIDELVDDYYDTVYDTYISAAENNNMSIEDYVRYFHQMSLSEFTEGLKESVTEIVKEQLVLKAVAEKEGLEVTKGSAEYKEYMTSYLVEYGYESEEAFINHYGEDSVLESMTYDKALEFVAANSVAEEQ